MTAHSDGGPSGDERRRGDPPAKRRRLWRDDLLWIGSVVAPGVLVLVLYLILR